MFGWFRKKAAQERARLIFQNSAAISRFRTYFEMVGDVSKAGILKRFENDNQRISDALFADVELSGEDLKSLLEINKEMRRLFDEFQQNGPEARARRAMGQPARSQTFDEAFRILAM